LITCLVIKKEKINMREVKFTNIDEYIALQPEPVRGKLQQIRQTIAKSVPGASEAISYQMPLFKYHGMLAYFAAFKDHYSIFVSPPVLKAFQANLEEYRLSKSGIRIPNSSPVPAKLISDIVKFAAARNLEKEELKKTLKKNKS
jgi:uncharacterized protein YdhG (YjbR/CyaY superfamily)